MFKIIKTTLFAIFIIGVSFATEAQVNTPVDSQSASRINSSVKESAKVKTDKKDTVQLKKIAIMPFEVKPEVINIEGLSDANISTSVQQGLINQFTQSRKFRVVDRDGSNDTAYQSEARAIFDQQISKDRSKLVSNVDGDYIVTGQISSFSIANKKTSYYGENFSKWNVTATVEYKLLDLSTMEVKWANTVTTTLASDVATKYIEDRNGSYIGIEQYLFKDLSKTIADQIIGVAYPLTVLKVLDNNVYLNQGGNRVQKGSIYRVFERGDVVKDKVTDKLITLNGKQVAVIKIIDVMPKYSVGQIVEGNSFSIYENDKAFLQ